MACKEYDMMNIHAANYSGTLPELHLPSDTFQSHSTFSEIEHSFIFYSYILPDAISVSS